MKLLALSTASPALSLALFDAGRLVAHDHRIIGRGHAEAIMPAIATLLDGGRADAIIVDIGPGSFTGIRIGIAAARALGLAWGVPVTGCSGAALVAAAAFVLQPALDAVIVLLDAGRGQILRQRLTTGYDASPIETIALGAMVLEEQGTSAGPLAPPGAVHHSQPDVAHVLRLPLAQRTLSPQALYVRPPDAILPL